MLIAYHGTRPDEKKNLEGGIKLIPRPTDVSPVGPFFLTECRAAAVEWAKKISNGIFGGNNPGVLFTYELDLVPLSMYDFGEECSGESYRQWQKFVKYNWFEAETAGPMSPDHTKYDVIRCLTSKGPRPVIEPYTCDDGAVMVQIALLTEKAIKHCKLISVEEC